MTDYTISIINLLQILIQRPKILVYAVAWLHTSTRWCYFQ